MTERRYYVYLLTNWNNKVNKLVYFEETQDVNAAIEREKEIKKWRREKKNQLVNLMNPKWDDLSSGW
ncbi:MAG: hypothetical protein AB1401_11210 [Thermodesulfobacteriota bacterium]